MKREYISDAVGKISTRHIREAENYEPSQKKNTFFKRPLGRVIAAAVLVLCLIADGIGVFSPFDGMTVKAYAYGTDEKITAEGAVINTGTISDTGEMTGHPLMFYLSGKDIATVRFSCKNQQINFMDWTEKRDEYGNAQNFTVTYGEDSSEYYYLTINWIPEGTIRELTDNPESTIAALPDELREDIIVMEITFANGKTATKAMTVSLLDEGIFFAKFDDYKISSSDTFVNRIDSKIKEAPVKEAANAEMAEQAEEAARAYYLDTVFKVVSMERNSQTENEITFSVCVSKDGIVQEPSRTIWLQLDNGKWKVTNEGYKN